MLARCVVFAVLLTAAPAAAQPEPPARPTRQAQLGLGIVASVMETKSGLFLAGGGTFGAFLSVRSRPGQPWGWFADISAGYADVDGDSYRAEMFWLARFSGGATYSR